MLTKETVLIVVDMQNGFLGSKTEHIVPCIEELVQKWQALGGATVFTRFISLPDGQYERLINWKRLQTSPEIDICPSLVPFAKCVIEKNYYTAFTDEFKHMVSSNTWTNFAICGIATDSCVLKTAADAFELGYTPFVLNDACASHAGPDIHEAALSILKRFIGRNQVIETSAFLDRFQGSRGD